jgi:endonuclease/exonuclease/phosphatase family metal-dependent hydrolase
MEILSWNIQCGRGVDGRTDLARIAGTIRAFADPDVICLQEVGQHMPDLDGGAGLDQPAELARLFPEYEAVFGAALDRRPDPASERRSRFGNLVLSRRPALQAFRHQLPQPADPTARHMPRQATEIVVETDTGPLRIVTTHLEYHSAPQRLAQVVRLRALHQEVSTNERHPPAPAANGPYAAPPRPATALFCGDFNAELGSPEYQALLAPFDDGTPALADAWTLLNGEAPHPPTCGIFDRAQRPQGAHCSDYFFAPRDLAARLEDMAVDTETAASDHQPIRLRLRP